LNSTEKYFDPVAATQADLGVSSTAELCALKDSDDATRKRFCAECTEPPSWDGSIPTFIRDPYAGMCHSCKHVCINYYTAMDVKRNATGVEMLYEQCYACMTPDTPEYHKLTRLENNDKYLEMVFGGSTERGGK
jgi:hypothetical protein